MRFESNMIGDLFEFAMFWTIELNGFKPKIFQCDMINTKIENLSIFESEMHQHINSIDEV